MSIASPAARWRVLGFLSFGELLAMSPWFGASAVAPSLVADWHLQGLGLPALTIAVQLGFVAGALLLAVTGAADVIAGQRLFLGGAIGAALANLGFAFVAHDEASALPFRFLTGFALAGVYPVGMSLLATWFESHRGLAIGVLVGSLTVGSALPHLLGSFGLLAGLDRPVVIGLASLAAVIGGALVALTVTPGPLGVKAPRLSLAVARRALADPAVRLANVGYLGHMWELYAMWTWIPLYLTASFAAAGVLDPVASALGSFAVVAAGGVGAAIAGVVADRIGRTALTIGAMAGSGTSAVIMGLLFGSWPLLTVAVGIVWGVTVVADSAQFSAAVTELSPPGTAGSALAIQTAAGFLLTGVSITIVGILQTEGALGWQIAFVILAIGPFLGIVAMARLRRRPEARLMASGRL